MFTGDSLSYPTFEIFFETKQKTYILAGIGGV